MHQRISRTALNDATRQVAAQQEELFGKSIPQRFDDWKGTAGAGKVLAKAYALAACFYRRYQARGIGVSQRYIEEQLRDWIKLRLMTAAPENGFAFNSHLTRPMVLHMIKHKPEWRNMFELREHVEKTVERKTVTVVTERVVRPEEPMQKAA